MSARSASQQKGEDPCLLNLLRSKADKSASSIRLVVCCFCFAVSGSAFSSCGCVVVPITFIGGFWCGQPYCERSGQLTACALGFSQGQLCTLFLMHFRLQWTSIQLLRLRFRPLHVPCLLLALQPPSRSMVAYSLQLLHG